MKKQFACLALAFFLTPLVRAQKWELGGSGGLGFYPSQDVKNTAVSGSVKIATGAAASVWVGNVTGNRWGGEIRYDYQIGNLQASSQSTRAAFGAQSHSVHYDFLFHTSGIESRVRPFFAFGGGAKLYQGTGKEVSSQPLNDLVLLTKTSDTRPMASIGAGIKINGGHFGFRVEVHDYITPFPNKVIAPAQNSKIGSLLNDLVASFGVSLLF